MSAKMPKGICIICGSEGDLSFEHTPPHSAFNDCKVLFTSADVYWNRGPGKNLPAIGKQFQRGYGRNSICQPCNWKTGQWYVPYFADWCRKGKEFYDRTKGRSGVMELSLIFPLPVIKQVSTIFLARYGDYLDPSNKAPLVRFVLNKEQRYLDPKYRFWVYLVAPGPLRDAPPSLSLDVLNGKAMYGAEFSFPPYGYLMTVNSQPSEPKLREISYFTRYAYLEMKQFSLDLQVLPTHGPTMGDYRSFANITPDKSAPNVVLQSIGHELHLHR